MARNTNIIASGIMAADEMIKHSSSLSRIAKELAKNDEQVELAIEILEIVSQMGNSAEVIITNLKKEIKHK